MEALLSDDIEEMNEFMKGFGNSYVYCPWDVINYISALRFDPAASSVAVYAA